MAAWSNTRALGLSRVPRQTPRARLRLLSRAGENAPVPLFLPLVLALAAGIEALDVAEFLRNPTKLAKGLQALHQALRADGITCGCGASLEIEALGAELDWKVYPPRVVAPPPALLSLDPANIAERVSRAARIVAAVDATRRLAATAPGEPALVVALTGPGSLSAQMARAIGSEPAIPLSPTAPLLEIAGRTVLEVARLFLLAGANVVILLERDRPAAEIAISETWASVVTPISNLARFHKALPIMLTTPDATPLPPAIVPCYPAAAIPKDGGRRPWALALGVDQLDWRLPKAEAAVLTTDGELPVDTDISALRVACQAVEAELDRMTATGK